MSLLPLSPRCLALLGSGDLDAARADAQLDLDPQFLDESPVWAFFARRITLDPRHAPWSVNAVMDGPLSVGHAGFHEAPDESGVVEIGYTIFPAHRRRSFARAAVEILLERASISASVAVVRACIAPANAPSIALVEGLGFFHDGQVETDDGVEFVYDLARSDMAD